MLDVTIASVVMLDVIIMVVMTPFKTTIILAWLYVINNIVVFM